MVHYGEAGWQPNAFYGAIRFTQVDMILFHLEFNLKQMENPKNIETTQSSCWSNLKLSEH